MILGSLFRKVSLFNKKAKEPKDRKPTDEETKETKDRKPKDQETKEPKVRKPTDQEVKEAKDHNPTEPDVTVPSQPKPKDHPPYLRSESAFDFMPCQGGRFVAVFGVSSHICGTASTGDLYLRHYVI